MESLPQILNSGIILKTFTHEPTCFYKCMFIISFSVYMGESSVNMGEVQNYKNHELSKFNLKTCSMPTKY